MLILLPPSEGKSAPESGPRLDLAALSFPELTATRRRVLGDLVRLCRDDRDGAARTLGLGPTQLGEVGANTRLRREPCGPAIAVYTGVLYEALDHGTLSAPARARLNAQVAIASALWGLVRPDDLIPAYRLSGGTSLPGTGPLANAWRAPVTRALASVDGLIVDMRSSAYVALGPLTGDLAERAVTVRVLTEKAGKRTVVSHSNKATKGRLTRALVQSRRTLRTAEALADALAADGYRVELTYGTRGGADVLDVIVDSL